MFCFIVSVQSVSLGRIIRVLKFNLSLSIFTPLESSICKSKLKAGGYFEELIFNLCNVLIFCF